MQDALLLGAQRAEPVRLPDVRRRAVFSERAGGGAGERGEASGDGGVELEGAADESEPAGRAEFGESIEGRELADGNESDPCDEWSQPSQLDEWSQSNQFDECNVLNQFDEWSQCD